MIDHVRPKLFGLGSVAGTSGCLPNVSQHAAVSLNGDDELGLKKHVGVYEDAGYDVRW